MQVDGYGRGGEVGQKQTGTKTSHVITAVKIPWKQTNWPHTCTSVLLVRPACTQGHRATGPQGLALCLERELAAAMWVAVIKLIDH
jgi:hypothetical protein